MKFTIKTFLVTLISIITISCNQQPKNNTGATKDTQQDHHSHNVELKLNNEKRWVANTETTDGVNNMIKIMNSFSEKENIEAYNKLSKNLQTEFNLILQKCTMKGEPHNQLHNFLVPMKEWFQGISSSELTSCKESYEELNNHLKKYETYFK
ncbi:MAG: hypothetical protein OEW67_14830 [Cyclobacteriaceae bacterium]|nr:hypothetical protein [Cyclobacteriaceae bacterium]